jgi:uncharacterized protein YbjT (DUF2867 family)
MAKTNGTKINDHYENKKYGITGNKALSYSQVAEILSNALGRRITYVNITEEDARKDGNGGMAYRCINRVL